MQRWPAFTDNFYLPTPRLYQWNLDTGVELSHGAALELQHLGSRAIHLDHSYYHNQPLPGAGAVNPRRPYQLFGQIRQILMMASPPTMSSPSFIVSTPSTASISTSATPGPTRSIPPTTPTAAAPR